MPPLTLRDAQVSALQSLLSLNSSSPTTSIHTQHPAPPSQLPTWKVLVLDKVAQDVIATSLRVQDLRDQGVTLHMFVNLLPLLTRLRSLRRLQRDTLRGGGTAGKRDKAGSGRR